MPPVPGPREIDLLNGEESCSHNGLLSNLTIAQNPAVIKNVQKVKVKMTDMRRKELSENLKPEPLLVENPGRFVLFPIQDNEVNFLSSNLSRSSVYSVIREGGVLACISEELISL
ncbi:unnamed protein product [Choristocarpus tenellus]